jgi:hypothetical protein
MRIRPFSLAKRLIQRLAKGGKIAKKHAMAIIILEPVSSQHVSVLALQA